MKKEFSNTDPIPIDAGGPNTIASQIDVDLPGKIRDVNVMVDIDHTYTSDLRIDVEAPDGTRVLLVAVEGSSGNNFRRTTFDDAAVQPITGARAPFRGSFRPEGRLTDFEDRSALGTWKLIVSDTQFRDGGSLNRWSLMIETGKDVFANNTRIPIAPGPANTIESTIETGNQGGMVVKDLTVLVDIDHTWDNDLRITLIGPDSTAVVLVESEGGDGDGFDHTVFDDNAFVSVAGSQAPFRGAFRPEQQLSAFHGRLLSGVWTLRIQDRSSQDGGMLNRWELRVNKGIPPPPSGFKIDLEFLGGLTVTQRSVFHLAASRWAEVITGNLPPVTVTEENGNRVEIDDLLIRAEGVNIDGVGGVLGRAGPTYIREAPTFFPCMGIMEFDTADLTNMEQDGTLSDVILHEMGHVLGIGTLWRRDIHGLLDGEGSENPVFTGAHAMAEYAGLLGVASPRRIPVANTGGQGTREGHWREETFDHELMTGYVEPPNVVMPLSRMTVASLKDMGYTVDMNAANPYTMPTAPVMAVRSTRRGPTTKRTCSVIFPKIHQVHQK